MEEKNCFNRNKDNVIGNMIAQGEETIPEKDIQLLKDFLNTILNTAKLHLRGMLKHLRKRDYLMLMEQEIHLSSSSTL